MSVSEAWHPAGEGTPTPCLGIHLNRVMSVRLGLASVTRESVIEAPGAHGLCQVCLNATFEGVDARCQTTPLEQNTGDSPRRRAAEAGPSPTWGLSLPTCSGSLSPRPHQLRAVPEEPGGWLVGHPAHEALGVRPVPGLLLQLRVQVALLATISRAWIVVLQGREGHKGLQPSPCAECL